MPYNSISELPGSVQNVLPQYAQNIYKEAFDSAYDQYDSPDKREGDADREETAHRVAWSAVKKAGYEKGDDNNWHKSR